MNSAEEEIQEPLPIVPISVQYLITEYGNYVGLEGFAFDEENQIFLEIGGKDVMIEYLSEEAGLMIQSLVTTLAKPASQTMLGMLLGLNAISLRNAHGTVAYNAESQTIIWMDRLPLAGLTVEVLDQALDATELKNQMWSEMISQLIEDEEPSPSESQTTPDSFLTNAIAV